MLEVGRPSLHKGCRDDHSFLSSATRLMGIKTDYNLAEECMDAIVDFVRGVMQEDNIAPGSYYEVQKIVAGFNLPYEVIDVCIDNYMIYSRVVVILIYYSYKDTYNGICFIYMYVGVSAFFRNLCTRSVTEEGVKNLKDNIAMIQCNLERIFSPLFFDVMEHLAIYLARELELGGHVQYRWMYLFEGYMFHLKKNVKNLSKVEGCIICTLF